MANFAWGQSASSIPEAQHSDNQATDSPGTAPTSGTEAAPRPGIADSAKLEIIERRTADYPLAAKRAGVQGRVMVSVEVSETGDVDAVEVLSGDPVLAGAAVRAAKGFKFKPFIKNGKPVKVDTKIPFDFSLSVREITAFSPKLESSEATTPDASTSADAPKRVKVSAGVTAGLLIRKVQPVYPREAKESRVQGVVILGATIGKDGRIKDIKAVSGPSVLVSAAMDAVQLWEYSPFLLKGEPVEVDTQITVNFTLLP
ncbi:MAG: TonB family protein [Candidatus Korobacteraceae bacterium]